MRTSAGPGGASAGRLSLISGPGLPWAGPRCTIRRVNALDYDELVDRVAARTHGTRGDPLTRDEVEQVVAATVAELASLPELEGTIPGMSTTEPETTPAPAVPTEHPPEQAPEAPAAPETPTTPDGQPPEADPTAPDPAEPRED